MELWLRVDDPGGPGLNLAWDARRGIVLSGVRPTGSWLGLDRASVDATDDGEGSGLPAVVAIPYSAPPGCWVRAELSGALIDGERTVIVACLRGHPLPVAALVEVAARVGPTARWAAVPEAERIMRRARERYRRQRARGRRTDRPAWLPLGIGTGPAIDAGQSGAEQGLARVPPRFVRGLADLLDRDERILASVERHPDPDAWPLPWRRHDQRAAVLVLTDRQLIWLVDHVPPGRQLIDWGVDVTLQPVEAIRGVDATPAELVVHTQAGELSVRLASEERAELDGLVERLAAFIPVTTDGAVRRHYAVEPAALASDLLPLYGQADEARQRVDRLAASAERPLLAAFYAPRRERVRRAMAIGLTDEGILVDDERGCRQLSLRQLSSLRMVLSPLVGRVELVAADRSERFSYPHPLSAAAADFVRTVRRAWANT